MLNDRLRRKLVARAAPAEGPESMCAVTRRRFSSGCKAHPAISLPPEATRAGMEVTKCLKPRIAVTKYGDCASVQAATRVNAEQTSKRTMCRPTR